MQQKYKAGIWICALALLAYACSEFIEDSIEKRTVVVISPTDGTVTQNYTQTFWWEELEDALNYRLQIVYNRFDSAAEFRLDTLVAGSKFRIALKPAVYQWRVQALNGSSKTANQRIQNLRIDSTSIAGQDLLLTSPGNENISNNPNIVFRWESLAGATEYKLDLYTPANTLVLDTTLKNVTQFSHVVDNDAAYYWQVTGKRKDILSNPSDKWKFVVDRTAPDSARLTSPASKASVISPVTLSWNAPALTDDLLHYEVYLYKSSEGTPFSDKYNPYSTAGDVLPLKRSIVFSEGKPGDRILWRVRTVDKAGNRSSAEKLRSFTIQ
jgi:hypothetical protein